MEYLEGWELVPGNDDGGREKISSSTIHGCDESQTESEEVLVSPRLGTEIPTEKAEEEEEEEEEILTPTIIAEAMEAEEDPDPVSPISFDNTKETEFVDMKSPESKSKAFNEEEEEEEDDDDQVTKDPDHGCGGGTGGGFDLWKWSWGLTGIGALVFVVVLGASGPGIQHKNNNMGSFKGYEENQRLKEMVSAVRGGSVPLTRAHITFGGYYDAPPSLNH